MRKTYTIRNTQELACPEIGTLKLDSSVGLLAFVELAKNGYLNIVPAMTDEKAESIRAEQERNEADLEDPEGALARTQAEIDAAASKLPEGEYKLEDLRPKQLKALCEQYGLKTYGTGDDLLKRLQEHRISQAEAAERAAAQSGDVDLNTLKVPELQAIARGYGVSDKGKRKDLIERIFAAAQAKEAAEAEGEEGEEEGEDDLTDQTDRTDRTDREEGEDTTDLTDTTDGNTDEGLKAEGDSTDDTPPTPPQAGGTNEGMAG